MKSLILDFEGDKVMDEILIVEGLKGFWRTRFGYIKAVDDVSFNMRRTEVVGIVGESGCGKSTLSRLLTGAVEPPLQYIDGKVLIEGLDLYSLSPRERRKRVNGKLISLVPQSAMNALNPTKKIIDLIVDVVREHQPRCSKEEIFKIAAEKFREVGLQPDVLDLYPFELSGGMRQRAVIAISILLNPKVVITDEPTSALDVSTQKVILNVLWRLKRMGISLIFITHDIATVRQISDRMMVMYAGKVVEIGGTESVIHDPLHPYTKALMSAVISLEKEIREKQIKSIPGAPPDLLNPPLGCRFSPRCPYSTAICKKKSPPLKDINGRSVACWMV